MSSILFCVVISISLNDVFAKQMSQAQNTHRIVVGKIGGALWLFVVGQARINGGKIIVQIGVFCDLLFGFVDVRISRCPKGTIRNTGIDKADATLFGILGKILAQIEIRRVCAL